MKESPIIFSAPMVQAILAGRKTQTRRLIKPQPDIDGLWDDDNFPRSLQSTLKGWNGSTETGESREFKCPYGKPGDLIWVRENFRVNSWVPDDGEIDFRYEADGATSDYVFLDEDIFNRYWEQSCDDLAEAGYQIGPDENYSDYDPKSLRLRPCIHMPKSVARIWLEIVSIKPEKLTDISEKDAKAEGVEQLPFDDFYGQEFKRLWERLNGPDSWQPVWVWVITFRVLSKTGRPDTATLSSVPDAWKREND